MQNITNVIYLLFTFVKNAMRDRLRKFLTQEGISPSQFADEIGVQRSAISHILSGRNYPSYEIIVKILNRYKRLSPDWLLLGTGSMYRSENSTAINSASYNTNTPAEASNVPPQPTDIPPETPPMGNYPHANAPENESSSQPLYTGVNKSVSGIVILYEDRTFEIYHQRD